MGLLRIGSPLSWEDAAKYRNYVREHGVTQFLNTYNRIKDVCCEELLWGDELEYGIFCVDNEAKTVKLSCRGAELLATLKEKEGTANHRCEGCTWHPEYGSWMVEATPREPFTGYAADLLRVERNMRLRRKRMLSVLAPDEIAPTVTCLPNMGVGDFTRPPMQPGGPVADSQYISDGIINPHPRFGALTANIRARRGSHVDIRVPLYRDARTPEYQPYPPALDTPHSSPAVFNKAHMKRSTSVQSKASSDETRSLSEASMNGRSSDEHLSVSQPGTHTSAMQTTAAVHTRVSELAVSDEDEDAVTSECTSSDASLQGLKLVGQDQDPLPPPPPADSLNPAAPTVHMDAMAFGMGCCCLQVTFQGRDIDESRFMYDQLAVLSPIMLALSAATPILKGRLVDTDVRWGVIAASVDDRTPAERGEATGVPPDPTLAGGGITRHLKSRYDSISTYLHYCKRRTDHPMHVLDTYNDIPCEIHKPAQDYLLQHGVDPALAFHIAHLFTRDPLVIFDGAVSEISDTEETDHFENIQSTNWQTVRWKPPPPRATPEAPHIGWRTEFRSMEVQLTDLENAAFTVFVVLVTRVILAFDLNLYIPLSKVDENLKRAHKRGAATGQKFWWRQHMAPPEEVRSPHQRSPTANSMAEQANESSTTSPASTSPTRSDTAVKNNGVAKLFQPKDTPVVNAPTAPPATSAQTGVDESTSPSSNCGEPACTSHETEHTSCEQEDTGFEEMTIYEIMMGKGDYYPGLIPLCRAYLEHIGCDAETSERVHQYLELLRLRASGALPTAATWMRDFVHAHPAYAKDSVVSSEIAHDLMLECCAVGEGRKACPALLGTLRIHPVLPETGYDVRLNSSKVESTKAKSLIAKYANRSEWDEFGRRASIRSSMQANASLADRVASRLRADREPSISLY